VTGAVLLELDPRLFQARLAEAEATLVQSRQHRDEAMRELARTRELFDRTLLAVHDRQVAEIAAAEAEAAFRRAESGLVRARLDLEYSRLAAPFDAWVVEVMAAPGEAVVSRLQARPLAVVVPAGRMRARALLAREQLAPLRLGSPAGVTVDGQSRSRGWRSGPCMRSRSVSRSRPTPCCDRVRRHG
jgi:multidrug resistance efflux pump